jgi:hypothetical protein
MKLDNAILNMPNFETLKQFPNGLELARAAYCKWVDENWDFTAKREAYKHTICNDVFSIDRIQKMAVGAAISGFEYKNKSRK